MYSKCPVVPLCIVLVEYTVPIHVSPLLDGSSPYTLFHWSKILLKPAKVVLCAVGMCKSFDSAVDTGFYHLGLAWLSSKQIKLFDLSFLFESSNQGPAYETQAI